MNAHVSEIPDDPAELAPWLDRYVVGLDLAELVAELSAIHPDLDPDTDSLDHVLGHRRGEVLERGLSALPHQALGRFLQRPRLLFELQDEILLSGGSYWDGLAEPTPLGDSLTRRGKSRVDALFRSQSDMLEIEEDDPDSGLIILDRPWWRRPAYFLPAAAALVAVSLLVFQQFGRESEPPPWGWNKADALAELDRPDLYLNQLANSAEDWFRRRPEDRAGLILRIEQLQQGCSRLISAPHKPLAPEDRAWLVERCQAWSAKFAAQLQSLRDGRDPLEIRGETDATIRKLIDALKARAKERAVALWFEVPSRTRRTLET